VVSHSDISGTGIYPGTNNVNLDPLFFNPTLHDYRLKTNSPVLNAGLDGQPLGARSAVGSLLVDTDLDGLPDPWEWEHGLDWNESSDADTDSDGDGMTNRQEYTAGTNPRDPGSALRVELISVTANAVSLRFPAIAGKTYTVQVRSDAAAGPWQRLEDLLIIPSNILATTTDTNSDQKGLRFYRVITPAQP
jgi:hypothetical protein